VPADDSKVAAGQGYHLGDQQTQLAVTQDHDTVGGPYVDLLQYLARGGQRFGEHGCLVRHSLGHYV
jgi:hypothetical protein